MGSTSVPDAGVSQVIVMVACSGDEGETSDSDDDQASVGAVFDALADMRRRTALYFLIQRSDGVADIDELVEFITGGDHGTCPADRDVVAAELHHRHLPKLEDVGVVEYDVRSGTVRYRGNEFVTDLVDRTMGRDLGG